jgi:hypothetical protein
LYILTHPSLSNSARALAHGIGEKLGKFIEVKFGDDRPKGPPLIRWGNHSFEFPFDTPYNDPLKIRIAANKKAFAGEMNSLGIPAIQFHQGVPEKFPVVIRQTLFGKGGVGIEVCEDYDSYERFSKFTWSYWHNFTFELGVHIFDGKILKVFKKLRVDDAPEEKFPIRNLARGYRFARVDDANFPKLIPLVQKFSNTFLVKFGRLDIGWDGEGKLYRIIEFNSAPAIAGNVDTLNNYISNFVSSIFDRKEGK